MRRCRGFRFALGLPLTRAFRPATDSRGATCCAEIRAILNCDPAGPCLGFIGNCGDLQAQFADLQGPWLYSDGPGSPITAHDTLADYGAPSFLQSLCPPAAHAPRPEACHAFPDDAYVTDQVFVGFISVAVALPVDLLLARLFEASNEGDAPEQWLEAPSGVWKLLLGKDCHKAWNYDAKNKPVTDLVKWLARRGGEALPSVVMRLLAWLWASPGDVKDDDSDDEDEDGASFDSAEARADASSKRGYAFAGLLGVYAVWAVFTWVIFVSAGPCADARSWLLWACDDVLTRAASLATDVRNAHLSDAGRQRAAAVRRDVGVRFPLPRRLQGVLPC